jgi:hypothetical protein
LPTFRGNANCPPQNLAHKIDFISPTETIPPPTGKANSPHLQDIVSKQLTFPLKVGNHLRGKCNPPASQNQANWSNFTSPAGKALTCRERILFPRLQVRQQTLCISPEDDYSPSGELHMRPPLKLEHRESISLSPQMRAHPPGMHNHSPRNTLSTDSLHFPRG